jgi:AraC-like DNA-binding protein
MENLWFFLEKLWGVTHIPTFLLSRGNTPQVTMMIGDDCDKIAKNGALREKLLERVFAENIPVLAFEEGVFLFGGFSVKDTFAVILGPVTISNADDALVREFSSNYGIKPRRGFPVKCELSQFLSLMSAAYYAVTGQECSEMQIAEHNAVFQEKVPVDLSFMSYMMDNTENDIKRFEYDKEVIFARQIREGDVEGIQAEVLNAAVMGVNYAEGNVGKLAESKFKHFEYLAVTTIALAARAAIDGGLDTKTAYALSDLYLQKIEKCKAIPEIINLLLKGRLDFATKVRKVLDRRARSTYTERCKSFVASHLNRKFSLDDIASCVGVSKSYISRLFMREEGIGIMEYTRNKRVYAAINMLRYSNESISKIAEYLCFPSHSHFIEDFKKVTGVTPSAYRNEHSVIDI